MTPPLTTRRSPRHGAKVLGVRLSATELALVTAAAERAGLAPTTWVRQAAVAQAEAQDGGVEQPCLACVRLDQPCPDHKNRTAPPREG